jgi:hypothetical protein
MKVGFSFLSPEDNQRLELGRIKATHKLRYRPITITGIEATDNGKLMINEAIVTYLKLQAGKGMRELQETLGIRNYRGKVERSSFMQWFPKFADAL